MITGRPATVVSVLRRSRKNSSTTSMAATAATISSSMALSTELRTASDWSLGRK